MPERRKAASKEPRKEARKRDVEENPEARRLTNRQVDFLAKESGVDRALIADMRAGDLAEKLKWKIDPWWFFFQKVCGRVVKRNPVTGALMPVPFATVHVEDTDCNFLFYSPVGYKYIWFWPFLCSREEIATVETDECGNFCVWIPRWDIDRILRWRRERICLPTLERPKLIDIFDDLIVDPGPIRRKPPLPDPPPDFRDFGVRREIETRVGPEIAQQLTVSGPSRQFGASRVGLDELLSGPAPKSALPMPPMPDVDTFRGMLKGLSDLKDFEFRPPLGPFKICFDVFVPEWQTILDIPDVSFRVTQEQGGSDVTIYDEGYFDVRWDDTSIPDVVLEALPNALAIDFCDGPEIECANVPAIIDVYQMPLEASYHDDTTGDPTFGHGIRVNQPSPDGLIPPPLPGPLAGTAHSPYAGRLDLFGCFHNMGGSHYRVLGSHEGGPEAPIMAGGFMVQRQGISGTELYWQPQLADGWYKIESNFLGSHEHYLLGFMGGDGIWELKLELGLESGGAISPISPQSASHFFVLDQTPPNVSFDKIRWWYKALGPGTATTLPPVCPILNRQKSQGTVVVEVTWSASAAHLRSATLGFESCGNGAISPSTGDTKWYWQLPTDMATGQKVATFEIPNNFQAGCYTADVYAVSRAYSPSVIGASLASDWWVPHDLIWVHPFKAISVVDI
jgi:hypothetical protein